MEFNWHSSRDILLNLIHSLPRERAAAQAAFIKELSKVHFLGEWLSREIVVQMDPLIALLGGGLRAGCFYDSVAMGKLVIVKQGALEQSERLYGGNKKINHSEACAVQSSLMVELSKTKKYALDADFDAVRSTTPESLQCSKCDTNKCFNNSKKDGLHHGGDYASDDNERATVQTQHFGLLDREVHQKARKFSKELLKRMVNRGFEAIFDYLWYEIYWLILREKVRLWKGACAVIDDRLEWPPHPGDARFRSVSMPNAHRAHDTCSLALVEACGEGLDQVGQPDSSYGFEASVLAATGTTRGQ
jgi:hypothetical protein